MARNKPKPLPLPSGDQESAVLRQLQRGPLTGTEALSRLGVYRLAAVVLRLRRSGYQVVTEMVQEHSACGRAVRYARYHLGRAGGALC